MGYCWLRGIHLPILVQNAKCGYWQLTPRECFFVYPVCCPSWDRMNQRAVTISSTGLLTVLRQTRHSVFWRCICEQACLDADYMQYCDEQWNNLFIPGI
jgi:hypothetical protein